MREETEERIGSTTVPKQRMYSKGRREVTIQSRLSMGRKVQKERRTRYLPRTGAEKQKTGTEDEIRTEEIRVYQKDLHTRTIYYGPNTWIGQQIEETES